MKYIKWLCLLASIVVFCFTPGVHSKIEKKLDEQQEVAELKNEMNRLSNVLISGCEEALSIIETYKLVDKDESELGFEYITIVNRQIQYISDRIKDAKGDFYTLLGRYQWMHQDYYMESPFFSLAGVQFNFYNDIVYDFNKARLSISTFMNASIEFDKRLNEKILNYNNQIEELKIKNNVLYATSSGLLIVFLALSLIPLKKKNTILSITLSIIVVAGLISTFSFGNKLENPNNELEIVLEVDDTTNAFVKEYFLYETNYICSTDEVSYTGNIINKMYDELQVYYEDVILNTNNLELKDILSERVSKMKNTTIVFDLDNSKALEATYNYTDSDIHIIPFKFGLNKEYMEVCEDLKYDINNGDLIHEIKDYRDWSNIVYIIEMTSMITVYTALALNACVVSIVKSRKRRSKNNNLTN